MTIETNKSHTVVQGNGSVTAIPVPFPFLSEDDLIVQEVDTATLTATTLTKDTDYTVTGAGTASGGTVTLTSALASSKRLVIEREVDFTQEQKYRDNDTFPARSHENTLDRMVMMVQQLLNRIRRAARSPIWEDPPDDPIDEIAEDLRGVTSTFFAVIDGQADQSQYGPEFWDFTERAPMSSSPWWTEPDDPVTGVAMSVPGGDVGDLTGEIVRINVINEPDSTGDATYRFVPPDND